MERLIWVDPLKKHFAIELRDANKAKRNRSYSQASDCCGALLREEMHCRKCNEVVSGRQKRKLVKVGKEMVPIDAEVMQTAIEQLEGMEAMSFTKVAQVLPTSLGDWQEGLLYALPVEKKEGQYRELGELLGFDYGKEELSATPMFMLGTGVVRNNSFKLLLSVGDDGVIRCRKFVESSQRSEIDAGGVQESVKGSSVSRQVVEVERHILEKVQLQDIECVRKEVEQFRDVRVEVEEEIIRQVVMTGKAPEVKLKVEEKQEGDELARLKELEEGLL
jgi:hypothetical protein